MIGLPLLEHRELGEDLWIAVTLPSRYDGEDDLPDGAAVRRWTTVVLHPDELGWLRETIALNTRQSGHPKPLD
jgi:hypothetical protein